MKYEKMNESLLKELIGIAGTNNISTNEADIANFSVDETPEVKPHSPEIIIKPDSTLMVSKILDFANKHRIPVTPRGSGTGLSGGCIPLYGGISLSLQNMNRIIKINASNFTVTLESGVTLEQLNGELMPYNLSYPVHIGDMSATLGGTVATNAGGMNAVKYGVTRQHILGLEAVLASGEIVNTGGEFIKCSTGYDLTQLLIGSEGTLAVITRIILQVIPRPGIREILFIPFNNLQNAINTVPELLRMKTIPMGIEFLDGDVVRIIEKHLEMEVPNHDQDAFLMIIMEGDSSEDIVQYFSQLENICLNSGAVDFYVPGDERAKRRLVEFREKAYQAIRRAGSTFALIDAVVPRNEIANFMSKVKEIALSLNMKAPSMGHAGDGNIHIHPICFEADSADWKARLSILMEQIYKAAVSFGGTISGEHGIGFDKKKYLPISLTGNTLATMQRVKSCFDPNYILNPGKIFDQY